MSEFPSSTVSIHEARELGGLRLLVLQGVPSPWSQAARGLLRVAEVPYVQVHRTPDDEPGALEEWTGQSSFPAAMYEDEPPRSGWAEILLLAERLAGRPRLIPSDPAQRAVLFGIAHEICGEMGLGWCRRLELTHAGMQSDPPNPMAAYLAPKYGYNEADAATSPDRVRQIVDLLADRLAAEQARGNRFLLGAELTALDVYWATFCNLVSPLPPELLPMPEALRPSFTSQDPAVHKRLGEGLLAHRDFVYEEYLGLPVVL